MRFRLYTDGGARGNPGPAATASILKDSEGNIVLETSAFIGIATNNEAEYKALIQGFEGAVKKDAAQLDCFLDSELIVNQLNGNYKVKNDRMKQLFTKAKQLEKHFKSVTYAHIPREENQEADALVNKVLDSLNN